MKQSIVCAGLLVAGLFASSACGNKGVASVSNPQSNAAQSNSTATGELRHKAPDGWVKEQTTSSMRVAQYKLPKNEGDPEDALLVIYFFGATQGGAVQANIDRWISQMQQPDGSPSKDKAKTETSTVNGLKVTSVDVSGTYTAEMAPGTPGQRNDANYRMRAAVIETPKGNYFLKLVGPAKTMGHWEQSVTDFVKSFEFK
jgi:hypothetical protein